jgi:hypothetical protein
MTPAAVTATVTPAIVYTTALLSAAHDDNLSHNDDVAESEIADGSSMMGCGGGTGMDWPDMTAGRDWKQHGAAKGMFGVDEDEALGCSGDGDVGVGKSRDLDQKVQLEEGPSSRTLRVLSPSSSTTHFA